jgi:hypothetical protein
MTFVNCLSSVGIYHSGSWGLSFITIQRDVGRFLKTRRESCTPRSCVTQAQDQDYHRTALANAVTYPGFTSIILTEDPLRALSHASVRQSANKEANRPAGITFSAFLAEW